jgi:drug/metabolite transporter (DMT)-like permease
MLCSTDPSATDLWNRGRRISFHHPPPGRIVRQRHALGLLLVSVIWGTTFVAVKTAMGHASPVLFVGVRFALAAAAAAPLVRWREPGLGTAMRAGFPLGLVLAGAYASQTFGLTITSPARSAFVTGLNVSLVPAWALLLTGHRIARLSLLGLVLTLPGLWLLTSPGAGSWNRGDTWTLICAVLYALYLVLVERSAKRHAPGTLLFSQLAVTAVLALCAAPLLEHPRFEPTGTLVAALALTAFAATTGTTWVQLRCQPRVGPTRTALIFASEPVFAAFFSYLWFGERLGVPGWAGGGLILAGMLISELGAVRAGEAVPPLPPSVPPLGGVPPLGAVRPRSQ